MKHSYSCLPTVLTINAPVIRYYLVSSVKTLDKVQIPQEPPRRE